MKPEGGGKNWTRNPERKRWPIPSNPEEQPKPNAEPTSPTCETLSVTPD